MSTGSYPAPNPMMQAGAPPVPSAPPQANQQPYGLPAQSNPAQTYPGYSNAPTNSTPRPMGAPQQPYNSMGAAPPMQQPMQQPYNSMGAPPMGMQQLPQQPYNSVGAPPMGMQQPPQQPYNSMGAPQQPYNSMGAPPMGMQSQQQPYNSMGSAPVGMQQPYGNPPMNNYNQMAPQMSGGMPQQYGNPSMGMPMQQPFNNAMPPQMPGMVPGSVSLAKGGNMSLSKAMGNLSTIRVGLGWDVRVSTGPAFDLDASAFLLKADGRVRMAQDLVFYNSQRSADGSVSHHGDNLSGAGEGDDEMISVDLRMVPPEIVKIVFTVTIYEAELRRQNFGMVSRAFIRVVEPNSNQEICRYDLSEEASMLSSMIFGEVYRYNNEWKFRAIGQGIVGGLKALGQMYGLNLQ